MNDPKHFLSKPKLDCEPFTVGDHEVYEGMAIYDRDGTEYQFYRVVNDHTWLVLPIMEIVGWEGDVQYETGYNPVIRNPSYLYPKKPVPVVHKEISEAEEELKRLKEEIRTTRSAMFEFERDEKARQERILRHEKLALLDDWVGGKITHLVHLSKYDPWKIVPIADEETDNGSRNSKKKLKLLTLWGDSNGDLQFRIGQYSDGSGSTNYEVIPCSSEDDAKGKIREEAERIFDIYEEHGTLNQDVMLAYNSARTYNLPVPDSLVAHIKQQRVAVAQKKFDDSRENMANCARNLDEARRS